MLPFPQPVFSYALYIEGSSIVPLFSVVGKGEQGCGILSWAKEILLATVASSRVKAVKATRDVTVLKSMSRQTNPP